MPLTARQRAVRDFIAAYNAEYGYSPSMREIGRDVGLTSTSSVLHVLETLEAAGLLRRNRKHPRSLQLLPHPVVEPGTDRAGA